MSDWPTKSKDMQIAKLFIEQYATAKGLHDSVGMFEITTNIKHKCFELNLSSWVLAIAVHFQKQYGTTLGEEISRKVISSCLIQDHIIH